MNKSHTDYDVIIVGAGPAGGMCAYELSKRNLRILILDKEKLPRYKVCAGGLTKKAVDLLPEDFQDIAENHTYNVLLTLNCRSGFSKTTSFPLVTMVMREKFDYFLVQKSVHNGARLLEQTKISLVEERSDCVLVKTEKGNFKSRVIVGADGVTSSVARCLGLRKKPRLGVAIEGEIFPNNNANDLSKYNRSLHLDFNVIPKGYGWIFPKKDHLSVGVFTTQQKIKDIKKYFSLYLDKKGLTKDYSCRSLIGHQIPIGGRREILNTKRGLLIGDAAGFADPITGEGIYFGLRSGQIAAEAIHKSLTRYSFNLDEYTKTVKDEIINNFRYGGYVATLLYNLSFITYNLGRKSNLIIETFIKTVTGELSYTDIFTKYPKKIFNLAIPARINH
jgi:geranylgeranyl reductase family protein